MINRSRSLKRIFPAFGAALVASLVLSGLVAGSALALSYVPASGTFPQTNSFAGGSADFKVSGGFSYLTVSCYGETFGVNQMKSGTSGTAAITFTGCKSNSDAFNCTTAGLPTGQISTKLLGVKPVYLNAEQTKYGLQLSGEGAGPNWWEPGTIATFKCGPESTRTLRGWITSEVTTPLNVETKKFDLTINEGTQKAGGNYLLSDTAGHAVMPANNTLSMQSAGGQLAKFVP